MNYAIQGLNDTDRLSMSISVRSAPAHQAILSSMQPKQPAIPKSDPVRRELRLNTPLHGFYNAYNVLAATAAAEELGVDDSVIQSAVRNYTPATGRMEDFLLCRTLLHPGADQESGQGRMKSLKLWSKHPALKP